MQERKPGGHRGVGCVREGRYSESSELKMCGYSISVIIQGLFGRCRLVSIYLIDVTDQLWCGMLDRPLSVRRCKGAQSLVSSPCETTRRECTFVH